MVIKKQVKTKKKSDKISQFENVNSFCEGIRPNTIRIMQ